ncbi:unnamed protein product [Acanthoscelides obtectus]|uniref:Uncharacterized protein n=1 Tax=Acanthoscelides obtectus TaxID=200917 RepID=A0A9P0KNL9_ACAOB|nr:unnamed protein product [Acanthoscelides obtectus]CAK1660548.1 hypothetical protein AOBTE_LOCUS22141 [Acanthoscelides obtectus]
MFKLVCIAAVLALTMAGPVPAPEAKPAPKAKPHVYYEPIVSAPVDVEYLEHHEPLVEVEPVVYSSYVAAPIYASDYYHSPYYHDFHDHFDFVV